MNKKQIANFGVLGGLITLAVALVVAGITAGVGADILGDTAATMTAGSTERQATQNATEGVRELASRFPLIGTVGAVAIVIALLGALYMRGQ